MDYGNILTRSWQITWNYKFLWVLGFLAALTRVSSRGGSNRFQSYTDAPSDISQLFTEMTPILGLACFGLIIGLVMGLVSLVGKGGLISAVARIDAGEKVTLGEAVNAGTGKIGSLIGISIILYGPIFLLAIGMVGAIAALGGTVFITSLTERGVPTDPKAFLSGLGLIITCFVSLMCLLVPVGIVVAFIYPFAFRGVMLQNLGVTDAIRHGWHVLRHNIGEVLLMAILFLGVGVGYGMVVAIVLVPVGFIVFAPLSGIVMGGGNLGMLELAWTAGVGLCLGVLASLLTSVLVAWQSTAFTLAYQEWVGKMAPT